MIKHESVLQAYRLLVPYLFEPDEGNGHLLTAYNREYDAIPNARIHFATDPSRFKEVWFKEPSNEGSPDPESRKDYWERLGKLYSHKHVVVGDTSKLA